MSTNPKTIVVFLDASPAGKKRASHAATMAQRWGARLVGVHVVSAGVTPHPSTSFVRGDQAIRRVIACEEQRGAAADAAAALVGAHFRALCARSSLLGEFRPIARGKTAEEAILNSLHSDLVVVGHPEPNGLPDDMAPG